MTKYLAILIVSCPLAAQILTGGARVSTVAAGAPLTINPVNCIAGFTTVAYTCTLTATGGISPYEWTVLSGVLPTGLSLSSTGVVGGTPTATGSFVSTVQVTDSASPPVKVTATLNISITAPGACGPPLYNCARTDYRSIEESSQATVPPATGCQSPVLAYTQGMPYYKPCNGQVHPCTAGVSENPANPLLPDGVSRGGNLQSCGNLYGMNEVFTDPRYNNVQILRVGDFADNCIQGGTSAGSAFDAHENYILIDGTNCGVKWFDPVAFQIKTNLNQQGWVITSSGAKWNIAGTTFASQTVDGAFFDYQTSATTGVQLVQYHITNGVLDSTTPATIGNMNNGLPCWTSSSNLTSVDSGGATVPMCGPWVQGTYPAGSVIVPVHNNVVSSQVSGCTLTAPCVCTASSNPQYCHSFQLIHKDACTTGAVEPNWVVPAANGVNQRPGVHITAVELTGTLATYTYDAPGAGWTSIQADQQVSVTGTSSGVAGFPDLFNVRNQLVVSASPTTFTVTLLPCNDGSGCLPPGQGDVASVAQPAAGRTTAALNTATAAVIHDGTCDWADMWIPLRIGWTATRVGDVSDKIFHLNINNNAGQDAVGACYQVEYNTATLTYTHLNTCTGNAYTTVCTGGTGYDCTGGHWTRTFHGNVFEQNIFYGSADSAHLTPIPTSRFVMHGGKMSRLGTFTTPEANQCALGDNNASIACWYGSINLNVPPGCSGAACTPCTTSWCTSGVISLQSSIQGGAYVWQMGTVNFTTARTIIGTCCPGHNILGANTMLYGYNSGWQGGPNRAGRTLLPWDISSPGPKPANALFGDYRVGPCTLPGGWTPNLANCVPQQCSSLYGCANGLAPGGTGIGNGISDCLPWPCQGRYNTATMIGAVIAWDQHMDWNTNYGSDNTPICMNTYLGTNVLGPFFAGNSTAVGVLGDILYRWPPRFPWADEILCMTTDGSNKFIRQANQWNSGSELWFGPQYGYSGGTSNDGKFYLWFTDMWCTIGGAIWPAYTSGTAMVNGIFGPGTVSQTGILCGLPFQADHDYPLGEYVVPVQSKPTGRCESMVFKVTTAGHSGKWSYAYNGQQGVSGGCGSQTVATGVPPDPPVPYWNCAGAVGSSDRATVGCRVQQSDGTAVFTYIGRSNTVPMTFVVKMQ